MPTAVSQSAYKGWLYGSQVCKVTAYMQGMYYVQRQSTSPPTVTVIANVPGLYADDS